MVTHKEIPEIYLCDRTRRKCFGAIKNYTEFTETIRFNSCSEISFKVAKDYYDLDDEKWKENPVYRDIDKGNLIRLTDDTKYFSFPVRAIGGAYDLHNLGTQSLGRLSSSMTFDINEFANRFELQPETLLYNISINDGYNWQNLTEANSGDLVRFPNSWSTKFPYVGCSNYIPIQPYDVIATRLSFNRGATGADVRFISYTAHFYTNNDASTYVGSVDVSQDAIMRLSINSLPASQQNNEIKTKLANGGFVRFTVTTGWNSSNYADMTYASYYRVEEGGVKRVGWSFPYHTWLQVYSGERHCSEIKNRSRNGYYDLPMQWFVITSSEEELDGISAVKTVTAYSYEYTLSSRNISLSEGTLPLYIPPSLLSLVNGTGWCIDKEQGRTAKYGAQKLSSGLLNRVLEIFPTWTIGHISEELMTRYRSFGEVDDTNIYTFLMSEVQSAYQCYFVFNNNNKTISAYSQDDIVNDSGVMLTWDNAIKHLQISNSDTSFVTALRGHTADDTYGLGLASTTGNSFLYNFSSVIDEMDFVADDSDDDPEGRNIITDGQGNFLRYRTLKEAVQEWLDYLGNPNYASGAWGDPIGHIYVNSVDDYRNVAKKFVESNMELIKANSRVAEALAEYRAIAGKINTWLENDFPGGIPNGYYVGDKPRTPSAMSNNHQEDYSDYHSQSLYYELYNAAEKFYNLYQEVRTDTGAIPVGGQARLSAYGMRRIYNYTLSVIARRASLNYEWQLDLIDKYIHGHILDEMNNPIRLPILTPKEILALQPFIYEGSWTNDNAVFSETYGADDIVDTLAEVSEQQKSDLDLFISKPMYDFETDEVNWMAIEEMSPHAKRIRLGQTVSLNTERDNWVKPILLELYKNYLDDSDFKMTFTTDYNRKPLQFRFADLYGTITQTSVTDSTFTFDE